MYRLFRYFFFLAYLLLIIMYFLPHPEFLTPFYNRLNNFYDEIPSHFASERETVPDMNLIERELFSGVDGNINSFLNDLSVENALEMLLYRSYDDFVYLVGEYLAHNQYFEDIAVYNGTQIIYKLNQAPANNLITIIRDYRTLSGTVTVEFMFNTRLVYDFVNNSPDFIAAEYRSRYFYSERYNPSILYNLPPQDGEYEFSNDTVYKKTLSQGLKIPIVLFAVVQNVFNAGYMMQMLFLMLLPFSWILLMITDRAISRTLKSIQNKRQSKAMKSDLSNLEWLDMFAEQNNKEQQEKEQHDKEQQQNKDEK